MSEVKSSTPAVKYEEILGFPGYWVGNDGTIWSEWIVGRASKRTTKHKRRLHLNDKGYWIVSFRTHGKLVTFRVHRLMLEAFVGPCPARMETRHLNGVRSDNRLENLTWGTPTENQEDKRQHGTLPCGEKQWRAKMTDASVVEIRRLAALGIGYTDIAKRFSMSPRTIGQIATGELWTHLPGMISTPDRSRGSSRWNAKLTEDQVVEIKRRLANDEKRTTIAKLYGVHRGTIDSIAQNKVWKHVMVILLTPPTPTGSS